MIETVIDVRVLKDQLNKVQEHIDNTNIEQIVNVINSVVQKTQALEADVSGIKSDINSFESDFDTHQQNTKAHNIPNQLKTKVLTDKDITIISRDADNNIMKYSVTDKIIDLEKDTNYKVGDIVSQKRTYAISYNETTCKLDSITILKENTVIEAIADNNQVTTSVDLEQATCLAEYDSNGIFQKFSQTIVVPVTPEETIPEETTPEETTLMM